MSFKTPAIKRTFVALAGSALALGAYQLGLSSATEPSPEKTMNVCTSPVFLPRTTEEYETAKKYNATHYDAHAEATRMQTLLEDVTKRLNHGEEVTVKLKHKSDAATETLMDGTKRQSLCYSIR